MTTFKDDPERRAAPPEDREAVEQCAADFAAQARTLLLESVDHLDGRTRSRLTQARYAALAQLKTGEIHRKPVTARWLLPAGGLAVAIAAMIWLGAHEVDPAQQIAAVSATSPLDDVEIMGAENLELLEDLEFYAWLDTEAASAPLSGGETG